MSKEKRVEKSKRGGTASKSSPSKGKKIYELRSSKGKKSNGKLVKSVVERKKKLPSFGLSSFKVLKQLHPSLAISNKSMFILDQLMLDIFERLASEASRLLRYSKMSTLSDRDIQAAVKLVLPGQLAKHAMSEGNKAVLTYTTCIY